MMDANLSLLLTVVFFFVGLVILDWINFQFWKKYRQNKPDSSIVEAAARRLEEWIQRPKEWMQRPKEWMQRLKKSEENIPSIPKDETAKALDVAPEADPAASFGTHEVTINRLPTSENGSPFSDTPIAHVQFLADIPEGTVVNVRMEVVNGDAKVSIRKESIPGQATNVLPLRSEGAPGPLILKIRQWVETRITKNIAPNLQRNFFWAAIVIYGLVVGIGINRFPIYFFTDEAIHTNMIADFMNSGFKNYYGEFLPTFFSVEGWVNGTSVYVQLIPYLLFGKSEIVTRLTSALITLLGAIALALMLKKVFKVKYYWAGIFLLLTTPAWFLHARTAFEYAEVAAFYCIFLYYYSRYRRGDLRSLYFAVFAGALCFYTHGLGEILMGVTGLALFIIDFRFHIHRRQRKTVLLGFGLAIILALPFVRYYLAHPSETAEQVKRRGSYWADSSLTSADKIQNFLTQYVYGLNPLYWYAPNNNIDLDRHRMLGYGNGLWFTFPLMLAGLYQTIRNIRKPASRLVLVALLACPIPASVVAIGMPRMLWMAVPLAILSAIGLSAILDWTQKRLKINSSWLAWALFGALTFLSVFMLTDALVDGPTWFTDYSLYGMQYGASQVFQDTVLPELKNDPNLHMIVSPSWANGTEQFLSFFIPAEYQPRITFGQPIDVIDKPDIFKTDMLFVATVDEYNKLAKDPKFIDINTHKTILYPNGEPGFYVISLRPSDNYAEIIAAQHEQNRKPIEDTMKFNNETIRVVHSPLGSGQMQDIFDDNPDTLARVLEANPFVIDLYLVTPINTHSVFFKTGSSHNFTITFHLYAPGANNPIEYSQTYKDLPGKDLPPDPEFTMLFDKGPEKSQRIEIEVKDNTSGETSSFHLRTIQFK